MPSIAIFSDETSEYYIPKVTHAMTSIVILDPADENVHEAVTANRQRVATRRMASLQSESKQWQFFHKHVSAYKEFSGLHVDSEKIGKVCMPRSMFFGAFLFLTCLAFAQAIAVGIILSKYCFSKKLD